MIKVLCCYLTNTGKVRKINEDSLLVNELPIFRKDMIQPECTELTGERHLYIVADGLGGHSRGDLASRTVVELFGKEQKSIRDEESLLAIIGLAKDTLNRMAGADFLLFGLGTTIAGLIIDGTGALIFNCGDCRVYRLIAGMGMERLTKDHSLVEDLVDQGIITERQVRFHPNKNIVTSMIAGDLLGLAPQVFTARSECHPGEKYLICSDGVWENFDSAEMERIVSLHSLEDGAKRLPERILETGARDNFTFILIEIL